MIYANNKLYENHKSNCIKREEYESRILQLEHDVTEKEDECMLWYRRFEDAKEARSKSSAKTRKRRHSYSKRGKRDMNKEHDNSLSDDQTIKDIIIHLRLVVDQLGKDFMKAKDLIHELARRLDESKQCERDEVSRKIKEILKDKIKEGKITAKWIEDCLPSEYKRKYPTKSEDTSLSKENMKGIEVDASGNSEIVSAATSNADPNNIVVNYEGRPPDVENLKTDASVIRKDLEEEIKKSTSIATAEQQLSEQATVVELKTKIERIQSDLQSKSDENSTLHIQVKDLMSQLEAHTSHNDQQDKSFDVQFQYPYDPLQRHMASSFKKYIRYVPFTAKVDPVTKRIFNVQIHEENRDSEQII